MSDVGIDSGILSPSERERILHAMAELCAQRGYEATTVAAIAERAGVSEATFTELFGDKEGCVASAFDAVLGEVLAVVAAAYSPDQSEWDSATQGIKSILEFMAAHPSFAQLSYIGVRQMGPRSLNTPYDAGVRMLAAMFDRGRDYSPTDNQPASAARAAIGGAEAVVRREIAAGRSENLPALLPQFIYGSTVPFLGQEEAMRLYHRAEELLAGTDWA
ncbi:MAG TPA: helix-turn-helix domain-containing protein [Solirubrobacterales bacterium]|nr:helix-turn-helix domain-containing protein [Solirubrobacterales bacterium]